MGKESNFLFPLNAQLSLPTNPSPHGEGVKLSSPCSAKLSFSANSSPHGEESSFLLPKCKAILPDKSFAFYVGKILPHHAELLQILPHKSLFLFFFIFHFIFIYLFFFYFVLLFFSYFLKFLFNFLFFFAKLEILPQREKIIPQCLGRIIEE